VETKISRARFVDAVAAAGQLALSCKPGGHMVRSSLEMQILDWLNSPFLTPVDNRPAKSYLPNLKMC
jgi:hypothetical protein